MPFLIVLVVYGSIASLMAVWVDRTLEFWLSYLKEMPVYVPFWLDLLVALLGPIAFIGNVVSEIARLAVVF